MTLVAQIPKYVVFNNMSCPPSNVKFQLRRDLDTSWTSSNPLLQAGEPGFEINTNKLKVGDGTKRWIDLPYICDYQLVFSASGNVRTLTGLKENNKVLPVRSADLNGNMFNLNLASFTPTLSVIGLPSNILNWDVSSTGFTVFITNPTDFLSQYISNVNDTLVISGVFSTLNQFTAGSKSATPLGGVNWNQSFLTNTVGVIRPISSTIAGGSSSAVISFKTNENSVESVYSTTITLAIQWNTPTISITTANLSGKTFLDTYSTTTYSIGVTGISNSSNYSNNISAIGGTVSSGTFTFSTPVHKDNLPTERRVIMTTIFTRPSDVTGTSYSATLTATSLVNASFTYPSFWIFTIGTPVPPTLADIISGTSFSSNVTILGNESKTLIGFINNTSGLPKGFWFVIRSSASQPTVFKSGASPSLLSDVAVTTGNTLSLQPSPIPSGYSAVGYTLYGITLQNGSTYLSIS